MKKVSIKKSELVAGDKLVKNGQVVVSFTKLSSRKAIVEMRVSPSATWTGQMDLRGTVQVWR